MQLQTVAQILHDWLDSQMAHCESGATGAGIGQEDAEWKREERDIGWSLQ